MGNILQLYEVDEPKIVVPEKVEETDEDEFVFYINGVKTKTNIYGEPLTN